MYYKSRTLVTASHSLVIERQVNVMTDPGPEESPTRYMLPEEEGKGLVDYSSFACQISHSHQEEKEIGQEEEDQEHQKGTR